MSWSYSGDPSSSDRDAIRFLIQDVDQERPLLSNEDIDYVVSQWMPKYDSVLLTAAQCCEVVAGSFAREVSVSADGVSVAVSELQDKFNALAESLRDQWKIEQAGLPIVEGVLFDEYPDPSIKPLRFGVGFMDNFRAGREDYGDYDPGSQPQVPYPDDPAWWPTE
jgi:hypothetical protein